MLFPKNMDSTGVAIPKDLLERAQAAPPLDLDRLFARSPALARPLELEIGMGKGTFLVQEAPLRPEVDFLGVEYDRKVHDYAADRLRRRGISNVRTYQGDAGPLVRELLPANAFQAVHVYFPDPWPKKRHQKRRILQADFVDHLIRILIPGGELRIVTDHPDYAAHIAAVLETKPLSKVPYLPPKSAGVGEWVGTNFERKYRLRDGRPSFAFAFAK